MREPAIVVGGTPAALVAADGLARRGRRVRLLLPERGIGSGFVAPRVDGRVLELGMRVLELGHEGGGPVPSLTDYRPGTTGHRPYLPLISRLVEELAGDRLVELPRPRMVVDGRLHDDLFLPVDPAAVRTALVGDERRGVAAELRDAGREGVLAGPLDALSLQDASTANHGPTLHRRLIAPLCDKLVAGGASRVLAQLRRRVWMPLLWPSSVREACGDGAIGFRPQRPFFTIRDRGPGELVSALMERLRAAPEVELETVGALQAVRRVNGHVELAFASGAPIRAERPLLAVPARELFAAAGIAFAVERVRTVIAWVEVAEDDLVELPAVTHVVDPELPALRVTAGWGAPAGRRLLCVELRHDLEPAAIGDAVRRSLEGAGLLVKESDIRPINQAVAPTFPVPSRDTRDRFDAARDRLTALELPAEVVGGAADLAGDYLNEQIAGGLRAAEVLA